METQSALKMTLNFHTKCSSYFCESRVTVHLRTKFLRVYRNQHLIGCSSISWLVIWLCQSVSQSVGQTDGWQVSHSVSWLVSWSDGWIVSQSLSQSVSQLVSRSVISQSEGWPIGWLVSHYYRCISSCLPRLVTNVLECITIYNYV